MIAKKAHHLVKSQPTTRQKALLIIFGLFLAPVVLEAGLRLAGFGLTALRGNNNSLFIGKGGGYRVLCLGESTTRDQYPAFLEAALNRNAGSARFTVIDEGVPGTDTTAILIRAAGLLDKYRPDLVVVMMGINDGNPPHLPNEDSLTPTTNFFIRSLRVGRLARLLRVHLAARAKELGLRIVAEGWWRRASVAEIDAEAGRMRAHVAMREKSWIELGSLYLEQGRASEAEACFKKVLTLNPKSDSAYVALGRLFRTQGQIPRAEASYKKALALNPKCQPAYFGLGRLYRMQHRYALAAAGFQMVLAINPQSEQAYVELGRLYVKENQAARAEDSFKKAVAINPRSLQACLELGRLYRGQGRLANAEVHFKKFLRLAPPAGRQSGKNFGSMDQDSEISAYVYGELALALEKSGKISEAMAYRNRASRISGLAEEMGGRSLTASNYLALKALLDERKTPLIAVQYPMRSVAALKRIFVGQSNSVTFVDNESVFKDAVLRDGLNVYFRDLFGGNFGHCTKSGNRLLGENIAEVIVREFLGSRLAGNSSGRVE